MDDKNRKWMIVLIIGAYFILSFFYSWARYGWQGAGFMVGKFFTNMMWLFVIGIILAILYFLFVYEKRIDANFEVYNKIVKETALVCPDNLRNLYISGDKTHQSAKVGKIVGLSIRANYSESGDNSETIFKIRVIPRGWVKWVMSLLAKPVLIRCPSKLHDSLQGDVSIQCTSLVMHGFYYYPNVIHLKADIIDNTIYHESQRFIQLDLISKISPLIYRGIGLTITDIESFKPKTGMDIYQDVKTKAESINRGNVGG